MDPQEYLRQLWEKLQQQYRNASANTYSGGSSIGANNPFNNQYFQQLTRGQLGAGGLSPGGAQGGQYGNDLSGVLKGLMDSIKSTAQPAAAAVSNGVSQGTSALHDAWNKLISSLH